MQVDVLLSCGHILIVPIESVLQLPVVNTKIVCADCRTEQTIKKVGEPYRAEFYEIKESDKDAYHK